MCCWLRIVKVAAFELLSFKDSTIFIGTFFFRHGTRYANQGGIITDIILQEMTWLIILMTIRE